MKSIGLAKTLAYLVVVGTTLGGLGVAPALADATQGPSVSPTSTTPAPTASPSATASTDGADAGIQTPVPDTVEPTSTSEPTIAPSHPTTPNPMQRPTDGGAVMGQAGKQARKAASPLAQRFSASNEPSVPEQPPGTDGKPLGLDVSGWQKNVNWAAVKNSGARFAYVKTSEGPWTLNDYFGQQYNGAASVGLLRGGYHFARPNLSSGASQAQVMLASGGNWTADGKTLPPALDIEDNPYASTDGTNKCYGMSASQLVNWSKDFTNTIKAVTGKDAVIYSSYYFWQECLGGSNAFANSNPLWIAAYYAASPWMPGGWPTYTFWQYANDYANAAQTIPATFPGDQNVFNGTMEQLRGLASGDEKSSIGLVPDATLISGKWAGDGVTYVGWFKNSQWCLEMPANTRRCFYFGAPGDKPVVGDWDGDGTATIGIVRSDTWHLTNNLSRLSVDQVQIFGLWSDTPLVGDWNGDRKSTIGIFRSGSWQVTNSQALYPRVDIATNYGVASDIPVVGDWNGDKWDTFGVWRSGMYWLTDSQVHPPVHHAFPFGIGTDRPAAGDWNGDGRTTVGVVRDNTWQLTNSLTTRGVDSVRS